MHKYNERLKPNVYIDGSVIYFEAVLDRLLLSLLNTSAQPTIRGTIDSQ
jgi:hypothetical protein